MKKHQVLLALVLAFSLGLATPLSTYAEEGSVSDTASTDDTSASVTSETELLSALANTDITTISIANDFTLSAKVMINRSVDINLNGHTISSPTHMFLIQKGTVNFSNGTISSVGGVGVDIVATEATPTSTNFATVTIGEDVTVKSQKFYAAAIEKNAYGVTMNIAGKLYAPYVFSINGMNSHTENCAVINILDGAELIGDLGDVVDEDGGVGVFAAGYAKWNIGAAKISGDMGFAIKSGEVKFNNTTIKGKGEFSDPKPMGSGIHSTGAAIQIEEHPKYTGAIKLTFDGGNYSSDHNSVFNQYQESSLAAGDKAEGISINGGTFTAPAGKPVFAGVPTADTKITKGKFSSDVSDWTGGQELVKVEVKGETIWTTPAEADDLKPSEPSEPSDPSDPTEPEIPADVAVIRGEMQSYVDKIRADETFKKYESLIKSVRKAETRVKNWGVTAMTSSEISARATTDYDASLIIAIGDAMRAAGSDTKLGEKLPADITKADLEAAIKEAKGIKNYDTYSDLLAAVEDAEKALADTATSKDDLKAILARLNELSKAEDPEDPAKPVIPGVSDINSSNGSAGGNFTGAGAPNTGSTGLDGSIKVSAVTCIVSGVLLAAAIVARRVYGKRKADKAEREFVKL